MFLTQGQIESFALIVFNDLSKKRTAYVKNVLTGFNDFDTDKCFYRWNSMLNVIYQYNPFKTGVLSSGTIANSFTTPNINNIVSVVINKDTDADPSDWVYPGNIIALNDGSYSKFEIVSVDGNNLVIRLLDAIFPNNFVAANTKIYRQSNCLIDSQIVSIMNKLNIDLQLNLCLDNLPDNQG